MPDKPLINLQILLPFGVFSDETGVAAMVVETSAGSMGILPRRMDCVAALEPGILVYRVGAGPEVCVAIDSGVLIKSGFDVLVSVRNAVGGLHLSELQNTVEHEFLVLNEAEQNLRMAFSRMETAFVHDIAAFSHG